jgi:hypothetical protein
VTVEVDGDERDSDHFEDAEETSDDIPLSSIYHSVNIPVSQPHPSRLLSTSTKRPRGPANNNHPAKPSVKKCK